MTTTNKNTTHTIHDTTINDTKINTGDQTEPGTHHDEPPRRHPAPRGPSSLRRVPPHHPPSGSNSPSSATPEVAPQPPCQVVRG